MKPVSRISRLFLSHDLIFFYLLFISQIKSLEFSFGKRPCPLNPFQKKNILVEDKYLPLFSEISFIIFSLKIFDRSYDHPDLLNTGLKNWINRKFPSLEKITPFIPDIKKSMINYFQQEKQLTDSLKDRKIQSHKQYYDFFYSYLNLFANYFLSLFPLNFLENRKYFSLKNIFELSIKLVIIFDNLDDFDRDLIKGNFNIFHPLISIVSQNGTQKQFKYLQKSVKLDLYEKIKQFISPEITFTVNSMIRTYKSMEIIYNKELIDNFIFFAFEKQVERFILYNPYSQTNNNKTCSGN